jgi:hypothetical protein
VSEYQYYEFTAVDRPLTTRERAELRSLSTRADITATSFVNTYEWGNFKGDPRQLMERYFDAHLYLANWGTRQLMLRLPARVLDRAAVADYCVGDSASAWTAGTHIIVRLNREDEEGTDEWDLDGHGLLASIVPVRADHAAGDLRLLYLGWLRCAKPREYDTAVQLLVDLRDLGEREGSTAPFRQRLAELRTVHARKPSLLERLELAGLDA